MVNATSFIHQLRESLLCSCGPHPNSILVEHHHLCTFLDFVRLFLDLGRYITQKTKTTVYQHMQGSSSGTGRSPTISAGIFTPVAPSRSGIFGLYWCICSVRALSEWKLKSESYADNTETDSSSNMDRDTTSKQLQSWCKGAVLAAGLKDPLFRKNKRRVKT